jgi:Toastrack DUF4097
MAQFQFRKEIPGVDIKTVKIRNLRGRMELVGWDRDTVNISCSVHFPGTTVPQSAMPKIAVTENILEIKSWLSHGKTSNFFDFKGFDLDMSWIDNLGDSLQTTVKSIFEEFIPHGTTGKSDSPDAQQDNSEVDPESDQERGSEQNDDGENSKWSNHQGHVKVDMTVSIPRNISVEAMCVMGPIVARDLVGKSSLRTVHGSLKLTGGKGELYLKTLNGPLTIEDAQHDALVARSINGPVKAGFRSVVSDVKISTVNGPIRVTLPESSSIELKAASTSGPVKVSSALTAEMKSLNRYSGSLGNGQHQMSLKTLAGPISVGVSDVSASSASPASPMPPSPPEPPAPPADHRKVEPCGEEGETAEQDSPLSIIDRMLKAGRISEEEADQLRQAI